MSKLNQKGQDTSSNIQLVAAKRDQSLGYSANGNLQFRKQPMQKLYELAVSTLLGKQSGAKTSAQLVKEIKEAIAPIVDDGQYDFIANLALHARTEMNIRTIPIVIVVEFAKALSAKRQPYLDAIQAADNANTKMVRTNVLQQTITDLRQQSERFSYPHMRQLVCDVIQRADQITDLYAYALEVFGSKNHVPMAIKRGIADAMNKFNLYSFQKYNRSDAVKFKDILRIVHPTAKDENQSSIFKKIMEDSLGVADTWETTLSANGQLPAGQQKTKAVIWTELLANQTLGHMALLRNLRNIADAGVDAAVIDAFAAKRISDVGEVLNGKQLPFDYVEAYKMVKPINTVLANAISKAIDVSTANVPVIGKRIWVLVDFSGSMGSDDGTTITTATLMAASLLKANGNAQNLAVTLFGSTAKTLNVNVQESSTVLGIQQELLKYRKDRNISGSTEFGKALAEKPNLGFIPDTIVVLTDGDVNRFPYAQVKNIVPAGSVKVTINMNASNTTPMCEHDGWFALCGFTPALFRWIPAIRNKSSVTDQLSGPYKTLSELKDLSKPYQAA